MLRMFHLLLAGSLIALVAVPALAHSPEAQKLIAAIEANGCVISEETGAAIQKASGLNDTEGKAAAQELMSDDLVEEGDDGLLLRTPACLSAELAPAVAALTVAIRAKDCRMTRDGSEDILEHSGLRSGAAEEALEWMMSQGQLVKDGEDLQLKTEGCL
ncbi:hypothetical protein [Falsigemmobacter intermedius]|uniref:hypothetical protein n=1 Tax=Falsigemmobacter intermedius TaxID=1553448 RepID=UPI003F025E12